jgi:membrane-bound lytic murein transglycosylase F
MRWLSYFFLAALVAACGKSGDPFAHKEKELVVLTRTGPTTYSMDEALGAVGFDHDLLQLFAKELGLKIRFIVAASDAEIYRRLSNNEAHIAAAWLTPIDDPEIRSSSSYFESSNILVTHEASLPIIEIEQLAERTVHTVAGSTQATALREVQEMIPTLHIVDEVQHGELDLLESIATQYVEAALIDSAVFDIADNYYPELQGSLEIGPARPIVWLFAKKTDSELLIKAELFLAEIQKNGEMARLKDRYFGHIERLRQADSVRFIERARSILPQYRKMFQAAQASTGIDWRLLAALAYQESQWDPLATSPTGVRGMMMLTEDTADHLHVSNRLDANLSIRAGAQYLSDLRDLLPPSTKEPDRLWMALAAYNLGMGHLNGARGIAQGLKANPDSWYEMKKVLPLLARPEYYNRLKSGKARGGEAVIMVENIRIYADILNRYEAPHRPPEETDGAKNGAKKPVLKLARAKR